MREKEAHLAAEEAAMIKKAEEDRQARLEDARQKRELQKNDPKVQADKWALGLQKDIGSIHGWLSAAQTSGVPEDTKEIGLDLNTT